MKYNNVVALAGDWSKHTSIEIEFDTESLLSVGGPREPALHMQALERLAMSQTLDDLQRLVWP